MRKFGAVRHGIARSGRAERERAASEFGETVTRGLNGRLEEVSVRPDGRVSKGNAQGTIATITFKRANLPTYAAHGFGFETVNWSVVDQTEPGRIWRSTKPGHRPDKQGIWLECDAGPVTASIKMWGKRQGGPREVVS